MIKQNPFEKFSLNKELLFDIKSAIKHNRYSRIEYKSDKQYIFDEVKILKIIFLIGLIYV